jgi:hypothetical protein
MDSQGIIPLRKSMSIMIVFFSLFIAGCSQKTIEAVENADNKQDSENSDNTDNTDDTGDTGGTPKKFTVEVGGDFTGGKVYLNGVTCESACVKEFAENSNIVVVAAPSVGYIFKSLVGRTCSGEQFCEIKLTGNHSLTVAFEASPVATYQLSFLESGADGDRYIDGIQCDPNCLKNYPNGTIVTLTVVPKINVEFLGFSGECTGKTTCQVTLSKDTAVTANFQNKITPVYYDLAFTGDSGGAISVNGVACGQDCSGSYLVGSVIELSAQPISAYSFDGFAGACTGTANCSLTVNSDLTITAAFSADVIPPTYYNLTYSSNIPGGLFIDGQLCTTNCSGAHLAGTTIALSAVAANGNAVTAFTGDCSGTGTCNLLMNADKTVGVTFTAVAGTTTKSLAWDSSTEAEGYKIYFGTTSGSYNGTCVDGQTSPIDIPKGDLTDASNPQIALDFKTSTSTCYLVIASYNQIGESNISPEITFVP